MDFLIIAILFLIVIALTLGMIIPVYKKHKKISGDIVNYDSSMRKFVYKVNVSSDDIVKLLETKNDADELSCTFDLDKSTVKFSEYGSSREYFFSIHECNGFSVLWLEQAELFGMKSNIPYKLNPFITSNLQAEIIPFSKYGF